MTSNPIGEAIVAAARTEHDSRKRSFVDVPEWPIDGPDGKKVPARIFYDPMTLEEHMEYLHYRAKDGPQYGTARVVAMKATDEKGERLFAAEHEIAFCKGVSAQVVIRLCNLITGFAPAAQVEKN